MAEGKVLIVGATGYIGRYIARASVAAGYTTIALVRRHSGAPHSTRVKIIESLQASGVQIREGSLDDHESLVAAIRDVDIVISAVGIPQLLEQLKLVEAMKEVKTVKRFIPSEFGQDVDKAKCLEPCQQVLVEPKVRVRRATEEAGIPHTYVITHGFAKFHFRMQEVSGKLVPPSGSFTVYGDGNVKASFVTEEDIATCTLKAASDLRTLNKTLHILPPSNALTQNETVAIIEQVTNQILQKQFISHEEILQQIEETSGTFTAVVLALMYSAHIEGHMFHSRLGPNDVLAHELYPGVNYTDGHAYLRRDLSWLKRIDKPALQRRR